MIVPATEIQNNFGKYLKEVESGDVIITKNGKKTARLTKYMEYDLDFIIREGSPAYKMPHRRVSYQEFLEISENSEYRYEYIDGEIYLLASPAYSHQKAVREILTSFNQWFRGRKCEPLDSPFDVTLFKSKDNVNVVQPDILVICDRENIDEKGKYSGVPALVVEILSESSKRKDFVKKLDLYMTTGVREYWIVNTDSREVYIYLFKDNNIESIATFKKDEYAKSRIFEGLKLDLATVF
jgi:prevent-host-death family protein